MFIIDSAAATLELLLMAAILIGGLALLLLIVVGAPVGTIWFLSRLATRVAVVWKRTFGWGGVSQTFWVFVWVVGALFAASIFASLVM